MTFNQTLLTSRVRLQTALHDNRSLTVPNADDSLSSSNAADAAGALLRAVIAHASSYCSRSECDCGRPARKSSSFYVRNCTCRVECARAQYHVKLGFKRASSRHCSSLCVPGSGVATSDCSRSKPSWNASWRCECAGQEAANARLPLNLALFSCRVFARDADFRAS
jgi:hypothetical protein